MTRYDNIAVLREGSFINVTTMTKMILLFKTTHEVILDDVIVS
jgi:hypothetical protein